MSDSTEIVTEAQASIIAAETAEAAPLTPLAMLCGGSTSLVEARGARISAVFSDAAGELSALVTGAAVFDAGARVRLRVTGEDRVRWLNGMVTNTVKALAEGEHNYTFVLNAQGRIQGDATVFALADELILETDRAQGERLYAHLDRFIIMDDVELSWTEGQTTLGLAGPGAEALLAALGLPVPAAGSFAAVADGEASVVVGEGAGQVRRFSLWVAEAAAAKLWEQLIGAGAAPAGALAVDALRVLEGTPLYGVDISEKTLAQETGQMRALNFNKGCYLGQEIVERVRSRANVHRGIRQFALEGAPAVPGTPITAQETAAGELTSVAEIDLEGYKGRVGLGLVRIEAIGRPLGYPGGSVEVLAASPLVDL
jgi:folate-binding protein YgfZ